VWGEEHERDVRLRREVLQLEGGRLAHEEAHRQIAEYPDFLKRFKRNNSIIWLNASKDALTFGKMTISQMTFGSTKFLSNTEKILSHLFICLDYKISVEREREMKYAIVCLLE